MAPPHDPDGKEQLPPPSQNPPQLLPSVAQALRPPWGASCEPIGEQVPSLPATSQALHPPVQLLLQQYPSTQDVPEMQPAATALQVCPCLLLQVPPASQVPAHRPLGSFALLTPTQVWLVVSQDVQVAVQSLFVQQPLEGMQTVVLPLVHDFVVDPLQA